MPVRVRVVFETQEAKEQLEKLTEEAKGGFRELAKLAKESVALDKLKDAFEGVNMIVQATPEGIFGIDAATKQAMQTSADYAEGLSKIGSLFGPIGSIAGGALGAVVGYFVGAEAAAQEAAKKIQEIRAETEKMVAGFRKAGEELTLEANIRELEALDKALEENARWMKGAGEGIAEYIRRHEELAAIQEGRAAAAADQMIERAARLAKTIEEGETSFSGGQKSIEALSIAVGEAGTALTTAEEKAKGFIDRLGVAQSIFGALGIDTTRLYKELVKNEGDVEAALDKRRRAEEELARAIEEKERKDAEAWRKAKERRRQDAEELLALIESVGRNAAGEGQAKQREEFDKYVDSVIYGTQKISADELALQELYRKNAEESDELRERRIANLQAISAAEEAERQKKKAEIEADFAELKSQYAAALAPLGQIIGATFGQIQKNIEAGNRAFAGVGKAAAAAVAEALKAMAKQWGAQALAETAAGLAALALGPVGGISAAQHFAAAAGFGLAAGAAGLGGAVVARATGGAEASAPPSAASSGGGGSPSLGGADFRGGQVGGTVIVHITGNMFLEGGDRQLAPAGHKLAAALRAAQNDRGFVGLD
jgi:hypothetical protein